MPAGDCFPVDGTDLNRDPTDTRDPCRSEPVLSSPAEHRFAASAEMYDYVVVPSEDGEPEFMSTQEHSCGAYRPKQVVPVGE